MIEDKSPRMVSEIPDMHWGRAWNGHEIEDACPCPKELCGLVNVRTVDQECPQHAWKAAKSTRQGHRSKDCPARIALRFESKIYSSDGAVLEVTPMCFEVAYAVGRYVGTPLKWAVDHLLSFYRPLSASQDGSLALESVRELRPGVQMVDRCTFEGAWTNAQVQEILAAFPAA